MVLYVHIAVLFTYSFRNGSSFEGIAYAYNDIHFGSKWMLMEEFRVLDRRRLSEAWFKWHLLQWKIELGEKEIIFKIFKFKV